MIRTASELCKSQMGKGGGLPSSDVFQADLADGLYAVDIKFDTHEISQLEGVVAQHPKSVFKRDVGSTGILIEDLDESASC